MSEQDKTIKKELSQLVPKCVGDIIREYAKDGPSVKRVREIPGARVLVNDLFMTDEECGEVVAAISRAVAATMPGVLAAIVREYAVDCRAHGYVFGDRHDFAGTYVFSDNVVSIVRRGRVWALAIAHGSGKWYSARMDIDGIWRYLCGYTLAAQCARAGKCRDVPSWLRECFKDQVIAALAS